MEEACGVFAVLAPGEQVASLCYFGLYALQHRGQESAGIAVFDGDKVRLHKDMGLVSQVFDQNVLELMVGDRAVGLQCPTLGFYDPAWAICLGPQR